MRDCPRGGDWTGIGMVTYSAARRVIISHEFLLPKRRVFYRMGMPVAMHDWTVSMLDALPDDGQRYELIDGELFVTPSPGESHQDVVGELYALLRDYLRAGNVGKAVVSPSDVRRGDRARNRVQPDVFVVRRTDGKRPIYPYELRDLLLAVEVASPGNPLLDYQIKRDLYLREGVGEYWIINPDARNVSRWRGRDDPGEVLSRAVRWHPEGMERVFEFDLPKFFDEAFR
ncbi:MAG: Uma2 family endonuclease [Gemmatimonadaceae bacterium]